jgi:nitroreductase
MTLSATEVDQLKQAPAQENVLPVILQRWSPRSFADRDVNPSDLRTVFEAGRWAASSHNEQPWRFMVGTRNSETYKNILSSLAEFNQLWARTAPVLILGVTRATFSHSGAPNRVALYDIGAAAATMCYQATALGLHTHQMAGVNLDLARELFNARRLHHRAAMALGTRAALPRCQPADAGPGNGTAAAQP